MAARPLKSTRPMAAPLKGGFSCIINAPTQPLTRPLTRPLRAFMATQAEIEAAPEKLHLHLIHMTACQAESHFLIGFWKGRFAIHLKGDRLLQGYLSGQCIIGGQVAGFLP